MFTIDDREYCVYSHQCADELIYIGSGKISRAFDVKGALRSDKWHAIRSGRPIVINIEALFLTRNEARVAEYQMLRLLRPSANTKGCKDAPVKADREKIRVAKTVATTKPSKPGRPRKAVPGILITPMGLIVPDVLEASKVCEMPVTTVMRAVAQKLTIDGYSFEWVNRPDANARFR